MSLGFREYIRAGNMNWGFISYYRWYLKPCLDEITRGEIKSLLLFLIQEIL